MSTQALRLTALAAGLLLGAATSPAGAGEWSPLTEASSVTLYASKQGTQFAGTFESFTATIDFDPAAPESGRIAGTVRTDSFLTDDDQNDTYVRGYLEVEQYPEARFESARIERTAEGLLASGELTLKGITKPAAMLFEFVLAGDRAGGDSAGTDATGTDPAGRARFRGLMTINRFDFGVAADVDTSWAGRDVTVAIDLALERRD